MAFTTLEDRLLKIRDAVDSLITGRVRTVQVAETQYTLVDIEVLEAMEARLESRIARRASGGGRVLVNFRRAGRA